MDAMNEEELRAKLTQVISRFEKIKVWQKTYYDKNKKKICSRNRNTYQQNKDAICARRRELYYADPNRKEKRRAAYLRQKEQRAIQ